MHTGPSRRTPHRRTITLAGLAVLAIGVILIMPAAIRGIAHSGLEALGFPDSRGGSVSVGTRGIRIADISIGHESHASVSVGYSPSGLLRGRLDTIAVTGTTLHGVVALDGGLTLDGYSAPPTKATAGAITLPAETVTVEALTLDLETPFGHALLTGNGVLVAAADALHLTGRADLTKDGLDGIAPADLTLSPTGWSMTLDPIRLGLPAQPGVANALTGRLSMAKRGTDPVIGELTLAGETLTFGTLAARALKLDFQTGANGQSVTLRYIPADGSAGITGDLKSGPAGLTANLNAAFSDMGPLGKALGQETLKGPLRASLTIQAGAGIAIRPLTAKLAFDGPLPGGIALDGAKLDIAGTFDPAANAIALIGCGAVSADGLAASGVQLAKLSGCIGPADGGPFFVQGKTGTIALAAAASRIAATLPFASGSLAEIAIASLSATATLADGTVAGFTVDAGGGDLNLPSLGAGLRGLTVHGGSAAGGAVSGALNGRFAAAAPNSPALPITGALGGSIAGGVTLDLTVGSAQSPPAIKAAITGHGARIDMPETRLGEGGADLLPLLPGLATKVSKLSGMLGFNATADWSGSALTSHGAITLKDVGATTPNFTVEGLNSSIALTSLEPLTIADKQVMTMTKLLVGVPLTDGKIVFGLDKRNVLNIAEAGWTIAGGTIATHDQQFDLYGPDQHFGVVVKNVDLAEVMKLVDVKDLNVQGILDGAVPLRRTKDTILVQHGFLQTRAGGVIRYDPADTPSFLQGQPGEGTAILREALKDFHYEQLGIAIDGVLGGEEKIKMTLKGANPAVYGGSAIALNLNLSGALDSIARSSIEAYTHPTEVARRKLQKKTGDKK